MSQAWEVTESGTEIEIMERDGATLLTMVEGTPAEKVKRAALIVRAVNAHEPSIHALNEVKRVLWNVMPDDMKELVISAIRNAEGGR